MYEPRLIKSFTALEVRNNSKSISALPGVEKPAPFSKYRARTEHCTNTSKLAFCSYLLPMGNWQGLHAKDNLILQLSLSVGHGGGPQFRVGIEPATLQR